LFPQLVSKKPAFGLGIAERAANAPVFHLSGRELHRIGRRTGHRNAKTRRKTIGEGLVESGDIAAHHFP
jgi:hypothetical protein